MASIIVGMNRLRAAGDTPILRRGSVVVWEAFVAFSVVLHYPWFEEVTKCHRQPVCL